MKPLLSLQNNSSPHPIIPGELTLPGEIERRNIMFGKKTYNFGNQRGGLIQNTSRLLQKGSEAVAALDNSNGHIAEAIEEALRKVINGHEDVQFIKHRIATKLCIDVPMDIIPEIDDEKLTVKKYALVVPNAQGMLVPAVEKEDMKELDNYLTNIALTGDEEQLRVFFESVKHAVNTVVK